MVYSKLPPEFLQRKIRKSEKYESLWKGKSCLFPCLLQFSFVRFSCNCYNFILFAAFSIFQQYNDKRVPAKKSIYEFLLPYNFLPIIYNSPLSMLINWKIFNT